MNKDMIVLLLKRDIQELNLLTEGFEKLTEFPAPLLLLATQKAENILKSLSQLDGAQNYTELGEIDYMPFEDERKPVSEKKNFNAPIHQDEETGNIAAETKPVTEDIITPEETPEIIMTDESDATRYTAQEEHEAPHQEVVETVEINTFTTDTATDDTSEITLQDNPEIITKEVKPEHTEPIIIANKATILVDELMADHNESLGETIANHKIEDIRQAINIGDRFRFQRELFNGNGEVMNKTIAYLNQLQKFEEAHSFLKAKFNWTADNNHAEDFLQIVKRRY
ncbi:MAG TPA: hypothetical protein PKH58_05035 [Paludibacteraceae bacterium]|nr:hypothetical protein [Paludibacteraceae bacterium]HPT42547.1 hypothetical protein [Paludibacteraceae bacterium]